MGYVYIGLLIVFITQKGFIFLFSFLICVSAFNTVTEVVPPLSTESTLDSLAGTVSRRGPPQAPLAGFLFQTTSSLELQGSPHVLRIVDLGTGRFWCFPHLPGVKVNNAVARGSGQPRCTEAVL